MSITVCIPTYKRTEQLREAILSCINQSYPIDEIIIGDDSPDDNTQRMIEQEFRANPAIVYQRNTPSLGQADNVNNLFRKAKGDYLILLHDDDLLLPNAVSLLHNCIVENSTIDVVFGKQILINDSGEEDLASSEGMNAFFYRTPFYQGSVLTSLESGFLQQFPNDAYLIRAKVAREIGYDSSVGDACDFDFGLRLGKSNKIFYFLNEYTAKYRISTESVSNKKIKDVGLFTFLAIEGLTVPNQSLKYKARKLCDLAPMAVIDAINLKYRKTAIRLYFSSSHMHRIITLGGAKRFLLLLKSLVK